MNIQLEKVIFKRINSFFDINQDMELQVENRFSLDVDYSDDNQHCSASFINETLSPENPDVFNITLDVLGLFRCENIQTDEDKRQAHVKIYSYLFPYVQLMVSDLTSKAALPPLMIEMAEIDPNSVNIK